MALRLAHCAGTLAERQTQPSFAGRNSGPVFIGGMNGACPSIGSQYGAWPATCSQSHGKVSSHTSDSRRDTSTSIRSPPAARASSPCTAPMAACTPPASWDSGSPVTSGGEDADTRMTAMPASVCRVSSLAAVPASGPVSP